MTASIDQIETAAAWLADQPAGAGKVIPVEARIVVLKDELDNRAASSWEDMEARMAWWEESFRWDRAPSVDEERRRHERIAADMRILRGLASVQNGRRTNAGKAADVRSMLLDRPHLSNREIARMIGVSPQTVATWRKRMDAQGEGRGL